MQLGHQKDQQEQHSEHNNDTEITGTGSDQGDDELQYA